MTTSIKRICKRLSVALVATASLTAFAGAAVSEAALPDERGWELVSPLDKNGGQVDPPGGIADGGVLQAAAQASQITFGSSASFGNALGAPPASQYFATRSAGGWLTQNITTPVISGSYDLVDEGVPYQLFSPDLERGILFAGKHCRGNAGGCAVSNPPLAGTDAPVGYQNYYLRESTGFEAMVGMVDIAGRDIAPEAFDLRFAGASPDLRTVVLSSCSPLTSNATDGCGAGKQNLYKWTQASGGLTLVNSAPGAELGSQSAAVSSDGSRIYWRDTNSGNLELREGVGSTQVDQAAGGGGAFQTASSDGSVAFYTKSAHLWRYSGGSSMDLTPAGGVVGVLGASANGSVVYFLNGSGLQRWAEGTTVEIAPGADAAGPSTYPPTTGMARVSADGTKLVFVSEAQLTGYDNTDANTGLPDSQVFLYDADGSGLICASCNPRSEAPIGASTIPGAVANGTAPGSTASYKPRVLSADGNRLFFDSEDAIAASDSNANPVSGLGVNDAYQWEATGEGSCSQAGGCVSILSNGALPEGASFIDASTDGADAYFLTGSSLVRSDPGSLDIYDAKVGGGFRRPVPPIACEGDSCQILPPVPRAPTLATLVPGLGNPAVAYHKYCRKGYVKRKEICVKRGKHHKRRKPAHKGGRAR